MVVAILLAAGRGSRMGRPKADLELGGRTALIRCIDALAAADILEIRVVLAEPRDLDRARVLVNDRPDRGQTSSLKIALTDTPAGQDFAIHTVDHPLVTGGDVRTLLEAFAARPSGACIVAPSVDERRGHPTVFEASLRDEFLALADDEPAHVVVRRDPSRVHHVSMDRPWLVRDIDTPEDLADARAALESDSL
jgi:CTP:molybdopterin cytidylyltransferase MocA